MKSVNLGLGIVVASLALASTPAFAQKPESGSSGGPVAAGAVDRSSGGGAPSGGGAAVDRGSAGSSSAGATSSGSTSTSTSGSASNFGSGNVVTSPSATVGSFVRESAPQHRPGYGGGYMASASAYDEGQKATPRSSGPSGGGSSGGAVTRGGGSSSGGASSGTRSGSGSGEGSPARDTDRARRAPAPARAAGDSNNASGAREVPTWSRPRGDRPTTGSAVDRTVPAPDRNGNYRGRDGYYGGYYDPYGYGYGNNGYGYNGYGYNSYYDPFYGFGMGYGLYSGLGWAPYFGDPYGDPYGYGGGGGGGYSSSYGRGEQGNLKLRVKPRSAKVYVDGYFVGPVDQFDGAFQKLALNVGRHKVEIKADGFETAEFDVLINSEQTVTFQGELKRIQ